VSFGVKSVRNVGRPVWGSRPLIGGFAVAPRDVRDLGIGLQLPLGVDNTHTRKATGCKITSGLHPRRPRQWLALDMASA